MKKTTLAAALALLCLGTTVAQESDKYKKIDSLLTYLADNNKFMGAVTLTQNGKPVFEKAYGYADFENHKKADVHTKYKIGSISKMFTATAIFKLIEDKKLSLDTRLSKFYPKVKNADKITINNLLSHSSGIFNYTNTEDFMGYAATPQSKADMVKRIEGFESDFEPGTKSDYSNSNFLLLGYIIEDITKKPYTEAVTKMVIRTAGLKETSFYDKVETDKDEAFSYMLAGTVAEKWDEWDQSVAYSAGGIQSTPADLDTFITALFAGKIIKPESVELMTTLQDEVGRGIFPIPFNKKRFWGHGGHIEGFSSMLGYNREEKLAVALVVNAEVMPMNDILIGILNCYYELPYTFPDLKTVAVDAAILQGYTGTYACAGFPLKVTIMYEHGEFLAQATGQGAFPLDAISNTEFKFDAAQIKITFKDNTFILDQAGRKNEFTKE
ncbi:serine hydrolase domain-containing protein [Flavobacterium akiainvivens]|nr:serine hydrolase domain-containing protein [Flavobacterium akiainvivens]SFQ12021.1 CubicO group peptidase, beta-lactamase class C family [Flavobacterium akiainvivens]